MFEKPYNPLDPKIEWAAVRPGKQASSRTKMSVNLIISGNIKNIKINGICCWLLIMLLAATDDATGSLIACHQHYA